VVVNGELLIAVDRLVAGRRRRATTSPGGPLPVARARSATVPFAGRRIEEPVPAPLGRRQRSDGGSDRTAAAIGWPEGATGRPGSLPAVRATPSDETLATIGDVPPQGGDPDVTYPGAHRPDRRRWVDDAGLRLAVSEWGDPSAPPVLFAHGGFDFAGTYDVLAPLVAAGGWRVVSWDQRGHGDSDRAHLYSFEADLRDTLAVIDSLTTGALPVVGHSKGGTLLLQLADAAPHRVSHLVNLDGLPSSRGWPDVAEHLRTRMMAGELAGWLDHRRKAAEAVRKPGTLDELAERRGRMNPRLSRQWLRYLVTIGARHDADGWRWKIDPVMRMGGFGPWRPEWSMWRLPALAMPVLCVLGLEIEGMGWGTRPEDVRPYLPAGARFVLLDDTGHFVHIEKPRVVADLILELLSQPGSSR